MFLKQKLNNYYTLTQLNCYLTFLKQSYNKDKKKLVKQILVDFKRKRINFLQKSKYLRLFIFFFSLLFTQTYCSTYLELNLKQSFFNFTNNWSFLLEDILIEKKSLNI